jgi:hypothetical protein
MAKKRNWSTITVGRAELALFLGVSPRRVGQLAREGRIQRDGRGRYPLVAAVQSYIGRRRPSWDFDVEVLTAELAAGAIDLDGLDGDAIGDRVIGKRF